MLATVKAPSHRRTGAARKRFCLKTAARIVEMKTRIKIHLPTSAPDQAIWHLVLRRLPRLVT